MTYGIDNPGSTIPGRSVDCSPQVEEDNGRNASTIQRCAGVIFGLDNTDVGTDDPHTDRSSHSTDKEQIAPSELINQEQEPHEGHNGLNNTEDTGHQVNGVGVDTNLRNIS